MARLRNEEASTGFFVRPCDNPKRMTSSFACFSYYCFFFSFLFTVLVSNIKIVLVDGLCKLDAINSDSVYVGNLFIRKRWGAKKA